ncbi:jg2218 [Pararge aegeria aegeria]|uniref:Jg2218 protein n=1 Tax=Pararge aegeria aegeria TaxID=348720 RepID=A0A8S4QX17_9NEOP|nr:jg2218 [Pararge aegeria aegeria]
MIPLQATAVSHPLCNNYIHLEQICNLFENTSSSEWLLYISEWEADGQTLSNIRVTTKVCVHCVLSEAGELRDAGTALLYNVATKEVKTVVSIASFCSPHPGANCVCSLVDSRFTFSV